MVTLTPHIRTWGRTSELVLQETEALVFGYNTPPPFESEAMTPSLSQVQSALQEICEKHTKQLRRGFTTTSCFDVKLEDQAVNVYHIRNTQSDRIFLSLQTAEKKT